MNEPNHITSRRSVLKKGLLVVAGAFGMRLASRPTPTAPPPRLVAGAETLTFYADTLRGRAPGQQPGRLPTWNGGGHRHGDLRDAPNGKKVGEFAATCFGSAGPFQSAGPGGANLEFQTVKLADGTLFGIGSGGSSEDQKVHAIVGGTGRFAGAKGSYVVRRGAGKASERAVEFVITLLT